MCVNVQVKGNYLCTIFRPEVLCGQKKFINSEDIYSSYNLKKFTMWITVCSSTIRWKIVRSIVQTYPISHRRTPHEHHLHCTKSYRNVMRCHVTNCRSLLIRSTSPSLAPIAANKISYLKLIRQLQRQFTSTSFYSINRWTHSNRVPPSCGERSWDASVRAPFCDQRHLRRSFASSSFRLGSESTYTTMSTATITTHTFEHGK